MYVICVYTDCLDESNIALMKDNGTYPKELKGLIKDAWVFHADTKRQVVGLMKTIMDNFDPYHVDVMNSSHRFFQSDGEILMDDNEYE